MHTLDLSSNMLTVSSGLHLKNMIMKSPALRELNVSCNKLAEDGGRKILEGIFLKFSIKDHKIIFFKNDFRCESFLKNYENGR